LKIGRDVLWRRRGRKDEKKRKKRKEREGESKG
jgi:hypothetical protein